MAIFLLKTRVSDQLLGCYTGAAIGAALGAQRHGQRDCVQVEGFNPIPPAMRATPELDVQFLWADVVARLGAPNSGYHLAEAYRAHARFLDDGAPFGQWNLRCGLTAPASGASENPLGESFAPAGGAQIWGCLAPCNPSRAARMAGMAASVDHCGEAIWAAMFVAACTSAAFCSPSAPKLIGVGLKMIPFDSLCANCVRAAVSAVQAGASPSEAKARIEAAAGTADFAYAPTNVGSLVYALLGGGGDFGKCICLAASLGGAARGVCAATGAILGVLGAPISQEWSAPIAEGLVSGGQDAAFPVPTTFAEWADRLASLRIADESVHVVDTLPEAPAPAEPVAEGEEPPPPPPPHDPVELMGDNSACAALWTQSPTAQIVESKGLRVVFEFQEPPYVRPGHSNRLRIGIQNTSEKDLSVEPRLSAPDGWSVAFRPQPALLRPGTTYDLAAVVQCPLGLLPQDVNRLVLTCGECQASVVLLRRRGWLTVGPFRNDEGTGFEKSHRPEDVWSRDEVFMLRSNVPGKWKEVAFDGPWMPIGPDFNDMAGVVYYRTMLYSETPRTVRLVAATDDGVIVWVNRKKLFWYHDHHFAIPRAQKPYVAEVELHGGNNELMLKVVRCLQPIRGLWFYVLGEDGLIPQDLRFDATTA